MVLAHALRFLFPNADPRSDYRIEDDGTGARIAVWNLPNPQPTPAELQAASDAYDLAKTQADTDAATLRAQVISVANSAAGVLITNLSAVQVRALLAVLLWKAGALDKAGAVRPLSEWADRG